MRDSDTYQAILDQGREEGWTKGRVEELHRTVLRLGRKRFGEPDEETRQSICDVQDIERLEELSDRLLDVTSWDALLA